MTPKARSVLATATIALVAAAIASGITYVATKRATDDVLAQLDERDRTIEQLAERLNNRSDDGGSGKQGNGAAPASDSEADPDGVSDDADETSRQFAFVTAVAESGGAITLTLDFAQFLTGDAAASAAAQAGDESPPPNDYYISNVNPRLRTFRVAPDAVFEISFDTPEDTRDLTAGEFLDAFSDDSDGVRDAAYWFTLTNGAISHAEEQWLP